MLRRYDLNKDGKLDKDEAAFLMRKHGLAYETPQAAGSKSGMNLRQDLKVSHYLKAMGFGDTDPDWLLENGNDEDAVDYEAWVEHVTSHDHRTQNEKEYGRTIKLIETKFRKLGPSICETEMRAAIKLAHQDARLLPTLPCLTLTPAHALCECFGYAPTKNSESEHTIHRRNVAASTTSIAVGNHLARRFPIPDIEMVPLLQSTNTEWNAARNTFSKLSVIDRALLRVQSALAPLRLMTFAALRVAFVWAGIVSVAIGVIFLIIQIILSLNFFNCHVDQGDFENPVKALMESGDLVPMNFLAWDPSTPEPKCTLAVYISETCGWFGSSESKSCHKGGELAHPNACIDPGRWGSCTCNVVQCRSKCWKVFGGCCCEALMYRAPVNGRLEAKKDGDAIEARLTTVEKCAQLCYQSGSCPAFSITLEDKSSSKNVRCRLAMSEDVEVVEDDHSTTWWSKKNAPNPFSNGVNFSDLVANLKVLWQSGEPGTSDKWKIALRTISIGLLTMGGCLDVVAAVFPELVAHMNTAYKDIKNWDSAITQFTKFMSAGFAGNRVAIDGCAYMDNPDGLEALAAFNIYFQSRSINLLHASGTLFDAAKKSGLVPSDGYHKGIPTPGLDQNFQILLRIWRKMHSDGTSTSAAVDTDYEMEDTQDEDVDQSQDTKSDDSYAPLSQYGTIHDLITAFEANVGVKMRVKVKEGGPKTVEWLRWVSINVGQGDCGYQEFNRWSCQSLSVDGVDFKWTPAFILRWSGYCTVVDRRRVWVDGGVGRGKSPSFALGSGVLHSAGFTYIAGVAQPYIFDEALITHLDLDHFNVILTAVDTFSGGGMFQWVLKRGGQIRWNNYFDQDWRDAMGFDPLNGQWTNPYMDALNYVVRNAPVENAIRIFQESSFPTVDDSGPDHTWAKRLSNNGVAVPNAYWTSLKATINPERIPSFGSNVNEGWRDVKTTHGISQALLKLWYITRRDFHEIAPVYRGVGNGVPGQFDFGHTTSILWPRQNTLTYMGMRHSFGGDKSDTLTGFSTFYKRDGNDTKEEPVAPFVAPVAEPAAPVITDSAACEGTCPSILVELTKRAPPLDTGFAAFKNHLSITHKVVFNGARLVLTGDVISQSMDFMNTDGVGHLNADLFKVPHHGSSKTGARADLKGIQADKIILSGRYQTSQATGQTDPSEPYSFRYILWIIQEHHRARPDKKLDLYITDFPIFRYRSTPLANLAIRSGIRPGDCNYEIHTTMIRPWMAFNSKTNLDDGNQGPWYDDVLGANPVDLGTPGNGACDHDYEFGA
ncbi:hypothetical protein HDV00_010357 [Rhizophlyctis rosea]|nr:hypothetical protein HDV00_010357 [Rhizophlyctis rosea]